MLAAPYSFAAVNAAFVYTYCTCYQRVEVEEYGGTIELLKDGFMTSFALFLVSLDPIYTPLVSCVLTLKCFPVSGELDNNLHRITSRHNSLRLALHASLTSVYIYIAHLYHSLTHTISVYVQ